MAKKVLIWCCYAAIAIMIAVGAEILLHENRRRKVASMLDAGVCMVSARVCPHTIDGRIAAIEKKKPWLSSKAKRSGGALRIFVFKSERVAELVAPGWESPIRYPMTGFSGTLGPKLQEGDGQIPEGVYDVEYLNPNSRFYLSLKVSYPNVFDREQARRDGRENLGGDIMIHGKDVTIGCIPVGDDAIEDIFYLVHSVGVGNVVVVISPYDMRKGRKPELENSPVPWYRDLYDRIEKASICNPKKGQQQ